MPIKNSSFSYKKKEEKREKKIITDFHIVLFAVSVPYLFLL